MKSDAELKADVIAELEWVRVADGAGIDVAVRDGHVVLSGPVDSYAHKVAAQQAVRRIAGVRSLALDLQVRVTARAHRSDTEIAQAAMRALRWHSLVPKGQVEVAVEGGHLTLTGEVDWPYQRASAEQCVRPLVGVLDVTNKVTTRPRADARGIMEGITAALQRRTAREARHIAVEVDGGVVTLRGQVHSLPEHDAAIGTASAAPGVSRVIDQLQVV